MEDPTELNDLAKSHPAKLKEMQALFDQEGKANQVYPLINWSDLFPGFKKFQEQAGKKEQRLSNEPPTAARRAPVRQTLARFAPRATASQGLAVFPC